MLPVIVQEALPIIQPALTTIVSSLFAVLFLSRNTRTTEMEKLKAGKFKELSEELLDSGKMTYYEFYRCNNFLKIAKLADEEYSKEPNKHVTENEDQNDHHFDFDWFLRFFDAAGNVSNEDMQMLWARVLSGEAYQRGTFSLRTIELLRNMSCEEAKGFQWYAQMRMTSPFNEVLLLSSKKSFFSSELENAKDFIDEDSEWPEVLAKIYDIGSDEINLLVQCGVLTSYISESYFELNEQKYIFSNDVGIIELSSNANHLEGDSKRFSFVGHRFAQTATELFSVMDDKPSLLYLLDTARLIKYFCPHINVSVYKIESDDEGGNMYYDDGKDILLNPEYYQLTRLHRLTDDFLDKSKIFVELGND